MGQISICSIVPASLSSMLTKWLLNATLSIPRSSQPAGHSCLGSVREVSFFTGRGLMKIGGDQVLFLRSKGGSKDFSNLKGGSLIFFKEI